MKLGSKGRIVRSEKNTKLSKWATCVAWGIALGAMVGVIPKFSALWCVLFLIVFLVPVSLVALMISLILFSLIGPYFEPFFHQVGTKLLTISWVASGVGVLDSVPFVSWFRLNNSSVLGSVVVSCVAILPVAVILKAFLFKGMELLTATQRQVAVTTASEGNQ